MKPLLLATLNNIINRYLNLDIDSKFRLQKLAGKAITIELLPFHLIFQAVFTEQGMEIYNNEWTVTDTKISGTPWQMLGVMVNEDNRHRFFADDLSIEGDAAFAQEVISLFDAIEIDWEEQCAHVIGDVPAYHTRRMLSNIKKTFHKLDDALSRNISDYLHEEAEWFPTREALNDFFHDIDSLSMDVERMAARINHLEKLLSEDAS